MKPESETYVRIFCSALQGMMANPITNAIQNFWSLEQSKLEVIAESNVEIAIEITNVAIKKLSDGGVI